LHFSIAYCAVANAMKSYISIKKAIQQQLWTRKENQNTGHIEVYFTL